jgi:hypothetical protein
MTHIHGRSTDKQARLLMRSHEEGQMSRAQVEENLQVRKTRLFALLNLCRRDRRSFSLAYRWHGFPIRPTA